jgi:hypothetical protein
MSKTFVRLILKINYFIYKNFHFKVLRIQSPEGTKRLDFTPQDTYKKIYEKVNNKTKTKKNLFVFFFY